MSKNNKLTPNQLEFKKQQNRIKRYIKEKEKLGFRFSGNLVPEMPSRVTQKSLDKIKSIKASKLLENSTFYDEENDTIVTGVEGKQILKNLSNKKQNEDLSEKVLKQIEEQHNEQIASNKEKYRVDTSVDNNTQYSISNGVSSSSLDIYQEVIDLIQGQIPDYTYIKGGIKYNLIGHKHRLINLWNSTVLKFTNESTGEIDSNNELASYITSKWSNLEEAIIGTYRSSQQEEIEQHITEILDILSYDTPLSMDDVRMIEDLSEHL